MQYLIVLSLCILSTSKLSFQGAFGRKAVKSAKDALKFNIFIFIVCALTFCYQVPGCSPLVWAYGAVAAIFTVAYQIFYTRALALGNVSLSVLITNFSMVLTTLVSYVVFDDPISPLRFFGIILTIISFVICCKVTGGNRGGKKWLITSVGAMLFLTMGTLASKAFGESAYKDENMASISCMYIFSAIFGIIIYPIVKKGETETFKISFKMFKYAVLTGLSLAVYQWVYTYALKTIDGTFLFPAQTGGLIIMSALSSAIIFKDKFTKRQITGLVLGIIALIIMNF